MNKKYIIQVYNLKQIGYISYRKQQSTLEFITEF